MAVKRILTSFFFLWTHLLKQSSARNVRSPYFFQGIGRFLHFIKNTMLSSVFVLPFPLPTLGGTIGIGVLLVRHYEVTSITAVNDTTEKNET